MGREWKCLKTTTTRGEGGEKADGKGMGGGGGEGEKVGKEELKEGGRRGDGRRGSWPYSLHTIVVYVWMFLCYLYGCITVKSTRLSVSSK